MDAFTRTVRGGGTVRLIDADKIRNKLKQKEINPATIFINEVLIGLLDDAPTVDAVPVVRCEDCLHNSLNRKCGNAYCNLGIELYQLDDYCSCGERREDV